MATVLVVSPHLDDACLSFGGQISRHVAEGDLVLVHTVFAGSPIPPYSESAQRYHRVWDIVGDPMEPRRREDVRAMGLLGATPLHGDFLDAIYRLDEHGEWLVQPGTRPLTRFMPEEPGLLAAIADRVAALIKEHGPDLVATAAAVGTHVDHQRARDATATAALRAGVPLLLWEDLPYALWTDDSPPLPEGMTSADPRVAVSSAEAGERKLRAIAEYASQLPGLNYDGADVFGLLERRRRGLTDLEPEDVYGEVTWRVTGQPGVG